MSGRLWGASAYDPSREPVWHGPASLSIDCPCGRVAHVDGVHGECADCETFRCPRCESWVTWEHGCGESVLCDDCAYVIDAESAEGASS